MSRPHFLTALSLLVLCATPAANAATKPPAAPSGLTVKALGVNSFQVNWLDKSKNETGWEIRVALKGGVPQRFVLIPTANATGYTVTTGTELPGKELIFQMTAYSGVAGQEIFSKPTPIVTVRTLSPSTFSTPTMLVAKALDDSRIRLVWKDNSTSELGYQIESRVGKEKWLALGTVGPGVTFSIPISGFGPRDTRSFRVRAFKGGDKFTGYSNVAKATTKELQAPAGLAATALPEGAFSFKWKDRSFAENGFELQSKIGSGEFQSLGEVGANFTSTGSILFLTDTAYEFRMRAFRLVGAVKTYSGFSNVFPIRSAPLNPPTSLAVTETTDTSATLTWIDKSARETGYFIQHREVGTTPFSTTMVAANLLTATIPNLESGKLYEFRLSSVIDDLLGNRITTSGYKSVEARTKEGFTGSLNPPIILGTSFFYQIQTSLPAGVTGLTVTNLPTGLTFDSGNRTISGTLSSAGNFTAILTATFSDGTTAIRNLVLKSALTAPTNAQSFAAVNVSPAAVTTESLAGKFVDSDTPSAARVNTTSGTFDIIFFPFATPATVDNFLDYTDAGEYDNSFIHRSITNFVIQGGGVKHTTAAGFTRLNKFTRVVPNEPILSNARGTVAMAKLPDLPDSATSEWFVNVNDNSGVPPMGLNFQNGGFTVFGRVPAAGMVVVDQINALPVRDHTIPIGAGTQFLGGVPINAATPPAFLDPAQLVKISSVTAAPILTYEVTSQNPAVATASLTGTDITITGVAAGTTAILVKATDLDGQSVSQNIAVTVP